MNISIIIAIALFFAAVILSQKVGVSAREKLEDEMRLKIGDVFAKKNLNYSMIAILIIAVYLLGVYTLPQYYNAISIGYAVSFVVYVISKMILSVRKLKEIGAPGGYIRSVYISFGLFIGGAVAAGLVLGIGNSRLFG